jgi:hypothetical protein
MECKNHFDMKLRLILFFGLLFNFSYFYQGGGWNQGAIIAEIRSWAEQGTFSINPYEKVTGDVSSYKGKLFSNKTPSVLFFVAPIYKLSFSALKTLGVDVENRDVQVALTYLITFLAASVWGAGAGVIIFNLLGETYSGFTLRDQFFLTLALSLGTILFPYSTVAFSHAFESFWAMLSLWLTFRYRRTQQAWSLYLSSIATGFWILANPGVAPVLAVFIYFHRRSRRLVLALLLMILPFIPLFIYDTVNFGHPLRTNRLYMVGFTSPHLFLGVFNWPDVGRLFKLLSFSRISIAPSMTHLLGGLLAYRLLRQTKTRSQANFYYLLAILICYLVFFMTFNGYNGGVCYGPRYMIPALLILGIFSVPAALKWPRSYVLLSSLSLCLQFIITSTRTALLDGGGQRHLFKVIIPAFFHGEFRFQSDPIAVLPFAEHGEKFNLGLLLGLEGFYSLLPLILINITVFVIPLFFWQTKDEWSP